MARLRRVIGASYGHDVNPNSEPRVSAPEKAYQPSLGDFGEPLHEVTFVVVDLETTGTSAQSAAITEFGAVKVRGGEVLGEFQSLVNPHQPISPYIAQLTGITNAMVATAPSLESVLPAFLEFLGDAVVVAHNAKFDVGFLRAACRQLEYTWPGNEVVDTVQLARRVVPRSEAPNCKLSTLAALFGARVTPEHRALADALATVDVLHALLERLAHWGVTHRGDLKSATARVPEEIRRKHTLATDLPDAPGVYLFLGPSNEILYIGRSRSIRNRVKSYFTASEKRGRIAEMLRLATSVTPLVCATDLEARVREIRLIAQHKPWYNQQSKNPERVCWLRLTDEAHPRLTITRTAPGRMPGRMPDRMPSEAPPIPILGPFSTATQARLAFEALHSVVDMRTCTRRLPPLPKPGAVGCARAELGRCAAPCQRPDSGHDLAVIRIRRVLTGDGQDVVTELRSRMAELATQERYEEATIVRNGLHALLLAGDRSARHESLTRVSEIVAASPGRVSGAWDIAVIRHGRLVSTTTTTSAHDVPDAARAAVLTAETLTDGESPAALAEEIDLVDAWLGSAKVRLLSLSEPWCHSATSLSQYWQTVFG